MLTKSIWRNAALMMLFTAVATLLFTENIGTAQMLGLFVCGGGFGAAFAALIAAIREKHRNP